MVYLDSISEKVFVAIKDPRTYRRPLYPLKTRRVASYLIRKLGERRTPLILPFAPLFLVFEDTFDVLDKALTFRGCFGQYGVNLAGRISYPRLARL